MCEFAQVWDEHLSIPSGWSSMGGGRQPPSNGRFWKEDKGPRGHEERDGVLTYFGIWSGHLHGEPIFLELAHKYPAGPEEVGFVCGFGGMGVPSGGLHYLSYLSEFKFAATCLSISQGHTQLLPELSVSYSHTVSLTLSLIFLFSLHLCLCPSACPFVCL